MSIERRFSPSKFAKKKKTDDEVQPNLYCSAIPPYHHDFPKDCCLATANTNTTVGSITIYLSMWLLGISDWTSLLCMCNVFLFVFGLLADIVYVMVVFTFPLPFRYLYWTVFNIDLYVRGRWIRLMEMMSWSLLYFSMIMPPRRMMGWETRKDTHGEYEMSSFSSSLLLLPTWGICDLRRDIDVPATEVNHSGWCCIDGVFFPFKIFII